MSVESFVTVLGPAERIADAVRVFGSPRIPVRELLPVTTSAWIPAGYQGRLVERACYFLAVERLTAEQYERLLDFAVERFAMTREECERELEYGFPIMATDTVFETNAREFL